MTSAGDQYLTLRSFLGSDFLGSDDAVEANSEASQQRMGRLNTQQFAVFTIDLIDEVLRRKEGRAAPLYLPARQDFHPKRNQTRQKLASLATTNFKRMACDVFFELERRHPNLLSEYPTQTHAIEPSTPSRPTAPAPAAPPSVTSPVIPSRTQPPLTPATPSAPMHTRNPSNSGRSIDEVMADLGDLVTPRSAVAAAGTGLSGVVVSESAGVLKDAMERMRKDTQQRTEALTSRIDLLEGELEGTKAALEAGRLEAGEVREKYLTAEKELEALQQELPKVRNESAETRKELNTVRKELAESRAESTGLRAELSQMRAGSTNQLSDIDKYRRELADANRRHQEAVNDSANFRAEIAQLRAEIARQKAEYGKQVSDYLALKGDYMELKSHIEDQNTLFGEVRTETTSLLAEVKTLTAKNHELRELNDGLLGKNEDTLRATDELSRQYEELSRNFEALQSENETLTNQVKILQSTPIQRGISIKSSAAPSTPKSPTPQHASKAPTVPLISDGVFDNSASQAYKSAIEDLLRAIRSDKSTVLPTLKRIISACKLVSESVEEYETTRAPLGRAFARQGDLDAARGALSSALAGLIAAAKAHIGGAAGAADRVEDAVGGLTGSVNAVARLVKDKCAQEGEGEEEETFYAEVQELKEFVEGQTATIVEGIQGLLSTMRSGGQGKSEQFAQELNGKVNAVVGIVKNIYKAGHGMLSKMPDGMAFRRQAEDILNDLSNTRRKLETLAEELGISPQSKEVRQGVATAAYDMAKQVKSFVALLDGYEE